ncbi:MAG: hypothetical protein GF328_10280, partial [Candidatus Latescibacteria bacterium]|nr:hypothetical protein [Candidatus Latescibacterota bacterium]
MKVEVELRVVSDAEPGTGLGGEVVDDYVPRTLDGRPLLRASHLRGLLREQVREIGEVLGRDGLCEEIFGQAGRAVGDEGILSVSDAVARETAEPRFVSRTALSARRTAEGQTLRTTEVVAAETRFDGEYHLVAEPGSLPDLALRLALLSLPAVGGGRTRGAGACVASIPGEERSPGELLDAVRARIDEEIAGPA